MDKKDRKFHFLKEIFLLTTISIDVTFRMLFLILSNVKIQFNNREFRWRLYTLAKILPNIKRVKLFGKKEFPTATMDLEDKTLIVDAIFITSSDSMHPSYRTEIASLKVDKAPTAIPSKHMDFADIFCLDLIMELPEYIGINMYIIELVDNKQPLYYPIYSLEIVKLETLKSYIKTNLANSFIRPFKSLADTLILFDWKLNGNFCFCLNY